MFATNPVLYADFPDAEILRVGDVYYLVTTTMHFFPGAQILQSRDLVNWQHTAYVYDAFSETPAQRMEGGSIYGQGMWAPTLRLYAGVFHLVFCCNDTKGCYHFTAGDIHGPWKMEKIEGFYHDPSLLFDEDGKVYIVYGNRDIYITQLKEDLSGPLPGGLHRRLLHDETEGLGWEGSHIHKINGIYYLCNIHWPKGRMRSQAVHASASLTGEFLGGEVLHQDLDGRGAGVAQGGIIDTPDGRYFMMLFQDHGAQGRMPVLVPFVWDKGMPKMGEVAKTLPVPVDKSLPKLYASDALKGGISPLWQWNHEPHEGHIACTKEGLRLTCGGPARDVEEARNTLTQRCFGKHCTATVTVDASALQEGDHAGICALQGCFGQLCVIVSKGRKYLSLRTREPGDGTLFRSTERPEERALLPLEQEEATLRAAFDFTADQVQFFYEKEGAFVPMGRPHALVYRLDHFTGCRIGLCAFNGTSTGGTALFRDFVYTVEA